MMFTSVVSLHMDPMNCGVAKFSAQLAKRLGVPMVPLSPDPEAWGAYPLLSLKWSELDPRYHYDYTRHHCCPLAEGSSAEVMRTAQPRTYGVFWHDAGDAYVTDHAAVVFYADPSLGSPGLWCPSLLTSSKSRTVRLFSFGMATKLQPHHYTKVRKMLDAAGLDYRLRVSVGIHEGTSLSDATHHFDALREIMGADKVTILGILSDEAVIEELHAADCVLAFFADGLRANNTTVHAALEARRPVVTNHDAHTPEVIRVLTKSVDSPAWVENMIRKRHPYSWDALMEAMRRVCGNSK